MKIKKFDQFVNENLNEKAVSSFDILSAEHVGVIIHRTLKQIGLTIYDFKNRQALAWIECKKDSGEPFQITKSAALHGYGPAAYDFLMMEVYPDGLMPDRESITPVAQNVWLYYNKNRADVTKKELKPGNPGYADFIKQDDTDKDISDPYIMRILNSVYYLPPTKEFEILKHKGNELAAGKSDYLNRIGKKLFTRYYYAA